MHKMHRIWMDYCSYMVIQCELTWTRHVFERVFRALSITQHHRIWPLYLRFLKKIQHSRNGCPSLSLLHYLKLFPEDGEEYIAYLIEVSWSQSNAVIRDGQINWAIAGHHRPITTYETVYLIVIVIFTKNPFKLWLQIVISL